MISATGKATPAPGRPPPEGAAVQRGECDKAHEAEPKSGSAKAVFVLAARLGDSGRLRGWARTFGWFGAVGAGSSLLYAAGMTVGTTWIGLSAQAANILGFALSAQCSYFGHRYLTFRAENRHRESAPKFLLQVFLGYLLSSALTWSCVYFELSYVFNIVFVLVALPVFNFVVFKLWVFSKSASCR